MTQKPELEQRASLTNRGKLRIRELMLFRTSPRFRVREDEPSGRAEEKRLG